MKINEVEQAIGMAKKNIRFYEQEGLLTPSRSPGNGYRDYSAEDIDTLRRIKLLRKLGMPIEEIKKLLRRDLTLENCLQRHLITLEQKQKNLDAVTRFCRRMLDIDTAFENMPAEQLLAEMKNMEEGGTRFMDIKVRDKRILKKSACIAAASVIGFMLFYILLMVWAFMSEPIPLPIMILFIALPLIVISGILLALNERMKEIEGGELDEASKY